MNSIDFKRTFKVRSNFYFTIKGDSLKLMDVASDDSQMFQISGPSKLVFERLSKGDNLEAIREELVKVTNESPVKIEEFLQRFVTDLQSMGVLEN